MIKEGSPKISVNKKLPRTEKKISKSLFMLPKLYTYSCLNKSEKCKYFNRGYCKQKWQCEEVLNDKVCEDLDCNESDCDKRHPNPCKFGPRCQFNKRRECLDLHVTLVPNDDATEALNQNLQTYSNN